MNPEFQRYLWIELTPHRLIVAPMLLLALFALVHLVSGGDAGWSLAVAGYWVTIGLGILWGARNAAEAVVGEVREGTWDQQRLSSIGPWAMTWGKLFGAPVFIWYASVPGLALMLIGGSARYGVTDAAIHATLLIAVVVFAHAIGLLVSLQLAARSTITASRSMVGLHLLGLLAGAVLVQPAYTAFVYGWGEPHHWFGMQLSAQALTLITIGSLLMWTIVACYRLMRAELQMRNAPWVWIAFVLYAMVFAAGLAWGDGKLLFRFGTIGRSTPIDSALFVPWAVAMVLAATMLFAELKDPVAFRRLIADLRAARWSLVLQGVPRWLCALPFALLALLAMFVVDTVGAGFAASASAFFARDAGIVVWLNLTANRTRADAAAVLYLIVLYGLLPALVSAATRLSVDGWLLPSANQNALVAVLPALLQAAVVWALVVRRWHRLWTRIDQGLRSES